MSWKPRLTWAHLSTRRLMANKSALFTSLRTCYGLVFSSLVVIGTSSCLWKNLRIKTTTILAFTWSRLSPCKVEVVSLMWDGLTLQSLGREVQIWFRRLWSRWEWFRIDSGQLWVGTWVMRIEGIDLWDSLLVIRYFFVCRSWGVWWDLGGGVSLAPGTLGLLRYFGQLGRLLMSCPYLKHFKPSTQFSLSRCYSNIFLMSPTCSSMMQLIWMILWYL